MDGSTDALGSASAGRRGIGRDSGPEAVERIAACFVEGADGLAGKIADRQRRELSELRELDAPAIWDATRDLTRKSLLARATTLVNGRQIPTTCPAADAEAVRMAARARISLKALLGFYRVGHDEAWKAWLEAVEDAGIVEPERHRCRRQICDFVVAYDQALTNLVTEAFETELALTTGGGLHRLAVIRQLLDGSSDDPVGLDYQLDQEHLGVVVWGKGSEETLERLRRGADGGILQSDIKRGVTMAWLGTPREPAADPRAPLARFRPEPETRLAVGRPGSGIVGFRRTHRQASDAYLLALRGLGPVVRYAEVELEVLLLRDEERAREFVDGRLGPLGSGSEARKYRETLRAYFAASQVVAGAASRLGVSESTVARRLGRTEERLGCPVNDRRVELELALRLDFLLVW